MQLRTKKMKPRIIATLNDINEITMYQLTLKEYVETISKAFNISKQEAKLVVEPWYNENH